MFNKEEQNDICIKYKNGESTYQISKQFNCHNSTISKVLKNNNIEIRDGKFKKKYFFNEKWLDIIDTQEKSYFLGLFFSDGCNRIKVNRFIISLKKSDKDILEKINYLLDSNKPLSFYKTKDGCEDACVLSLTSKYFCNRLKQLGAEERKSSKIIFPNYLSKDLISHFIRGYFDGDGGLSLYKNKNNTYRGKISIVSNLNFLNGLKNFLEKELNIKIYLYQKSEFFGEIQIMKKNDVIIFLNYIYKDSNIFLDRKFKDYLKILDIKEN